MLAGMHPVLAFFIIGVVIGLVAGVLIYLVRRAPFIPAEIKQLVEWFIIVVAVLYILFRGLALLGLA